MRFIGEADTRITDEAHTARGEVALAIERIVERAVAIGVEGIEGEVAPVGVLQPIVGEGHDRATAVGLDVAAKRREFNTATLDDRGHRAVLQPRRHDFQTGRFEGTHNGLRRLVDGKVDVVDGALQHRVAHAAAHEARCNAAPAQRVEQRPHLRRIHPGLRFETSAWLHDAAFMARRDRHNPGSG